MKGHVSIATEGEYIIEPKKKLSLIWALIKWTLVTEKQDVPVRLMDPTHKTQSSDKNYCKSDEDGRKRH